MSRFSTERLQSRSWVGHTLVAERERQGGVRSDGQEEETETSAGVWHPVCALCPQQGELAAPLTSAGPGGHEGS